MMATKKPTNSPIRTPSSDRMKFENLEESFSRSVPKREPLTGNRRIEVKPAQPIPQSALPPEKSPKK